MGTRADFYIGRGPTAEWIGSIAWDGYPDGMPRELLGLTDEDLFRKYVVAFLKERDDGTTPDMGWPWPWEDSRTTDYAYALDEGRVWASGFGGEWFPADGKEPDEEDENYIAKKTAVFPNMSERMNVTMGERSGLIIIQGN